MISEDKFVFSYILQCLQTVPIDPYIIWLSVKIHNKNSYCQKKFIQIVIGLCSEIHC